MRTFAASQSRPQKEESRGHTPRDTATPAPRPAAETPSRFAHDFSRTPLHPAPREGGRDALPLSSPGDAHEQEASRVSERVLRMSEPPRVGREQLQVKAFGPGNVEGAGRAERTAAAAPSVREVLAAPGRPLDRAAREFMEPRFGYDFSAVRVHTDAKAADSAGRLNALAYTVGPHIVFGAGRYAPASSAGRRLLAHELAHVLQPASHARVARSPEDENEEEEQQKAEQKAAEAAPPDAGTTPTPTPDAGTQPAASPTPSTAPATTQTPTTQPATTQPAAAQPSAATPGGHFPAPPDMAPCPDAPTRTLVVVGCMTAPSSKPPAAEKAELPTLPAERFGGDAERAQFAKGLARCRAEREVKGKIEKRYQEDVGAAKKRATEEAKADTAAAVKAATESVDPKDRREINRARARAEAEARRAATKKIADAQAAVTRQDVATVTAALAAEYENILAADYDNTMKGALARFGSSWSKTMQTRLDNARKRITKEKSARPKPARGEQPPPPKSAEAIAAEVEAEMVNVRCEQKQWVLDQLEGVKRAWAVGRREEVDFLTVPQKAKSIYPFKHTYEVAEADRAEIPARLQPEEKARKGVAPEFADFLTQLADDPDTPAFTASNRPKHGGGTWKGKGFSSDIYIKAPTDARGFWQTTQAVKFLLAVDKTAKKMGARWRVLYNDFRVAEEVNRTTGTRNVEFIGGSSPTDLNWHGPEGLILHFHLDLEIPQKTPPAASQPAGSQP